MDPQTIEKQIESLILNIESALSSVPSCTRAAQLERQLEERQARSRLGLSRLTFSPSQKNIAAGIGLAFAGPIGGVLAYLYGNTLLQAVRASIGDAALSVDRLWAKEMVISAAEYRCETDRTKLASQAYTDDKLASPLFRNGEKIGDVRKLLEFIELGTAMLTDSTKTTPSDQTNITKVKGELLLRLGNEGVAKHLGLSPRFNFVSEIAGPLTPVVRKVFADSVNRFTALEFILPNNNMESISSNPDKDIVVGLSGGALAIIPFTDSGDGFSEKFSLCGLLFDFRRDDRDLLPFLETLNARPQNLIWGGLSLTGEKFFVTKEPTGIYHLFSLAGGRVDELEISRTPLNGRIIQRVRSSSTLDASESLMLSTEDLLLAIEIKGRGWLQVPNPVKHPSWKPIFGKLKLSSLSTIPGNNGLVNLFPDL